MDKKIRIEDIKGPELSYMVFGKKDLVRILDGYPAVTQDQANKVWEWYSNHFGKIYDQARIDKSHITAASLRAMGFSQDGWEAFAHSIGLDRDTTIGIYGDHQFRAEEVGQEIAEREQAAAEAKADAEAEGAEGQEGAIPKEQARLLLAKILADPSHPYNDDKATPAEHDLAVAGVNRLYAILAGLETKIEGYAEQHLAEKDKELREAYGLAEGDTLNRSDRKASNNVPVDLSYKNGPDTGKDDIANAESGNTEGEGEVDL